MFRSLAVFLFLLATALTANSQNNSISGPSGFAVLNASARENERPRLTAGNASDSAAAAITEKQTFEHINVRRTQAGLPQLVWNDDLAEIAREHSRSMASNSFFSHRGLDGSTVDDRADRSGIRNWLSIGENIAYTRGYDDAAAFAVGRWMESTSHRLNLLDKRWTESGIGVAILPDGTHFFTQVFILRK